MTRALRLILLPLLLSLAAGQSAAQSRIDCNALNSRILKQVVRYCVYLPAGYDAGATQHPARRYPVLYFLHGLGDNEQTLFNSGGWTLLDDLRNQQKMGDFLIVAPEGRRTFYINSADGSVRYSDFLVQEFIPQIERTYRSLPGRAGRALSGISMGGYGALRLGFAHPELFSAVSAQSAALITESPKELDAAARTGAPLTGLLGAVFGRPIDVPHWNENSPFLLAKKNAAALRQLAIYFNCGQEDNYGFEKGAAALHDELQKEGVSHLYHPYPGDHSLTYFLSHFDEVMEFHSRAFGLLPQPPTPPKASDSKVCAGSRRFHVSRFLQGSGSDGVILSPAKFWSTEEGVMITAPRPMTTGELMDRTFSLYRSHLGLFIGIFALPHLVVLAFQCWGVAVEPPGFTNIMQRLPWMYGAMFLARILNAVSMAATVAAVSEVHFDRAASMTESFFRVKGQILGVIGLSLLVALAGYMACMFLIVPGVYLFVMWSLSIPAKVVEKKGILEAMSRSSDLTQGRRWRIFVIGFLFFLLVFVMNQLLQWPINLATGLSGDVTVQGAGRGWQVAYLVSTFVSECLVGPLPAIAFSLVYYDERVRKEAFDLQLMIMTLDASPQPGSLAPAGA